MHEGDANTKFFHLQACHRSRKNVIDQLQLHGSTIFDEDKKARAFFQHFDAVLGCYEDCMRCLDFSYLGLPCENTLALDQCFLEEEIRRVVRAMPAEKAPGPDGLSDLFYQTAWPVFKDNIMRAFHALWSLDYHISYLVNQAYMMLL